ncbi:HlyD family efflux transporter periplasmic adaptor subunit [Prosthecobacter sp.]|uniref:efflux RND transporter periplasmic adaptor subunit n=1 Tax=Prosthecobacter sp. TaxID=1965333 RepID=UPI002AB95C81|nr:HlyD family efflux transporter periplasmic adaptor subunit [Prosthecobacter sp.]MDZ4405460.1 efflux RND transporter periplasmic adaptor subunit [Prosthecobacter sp.]
MKLPSLLRRILPWLIVAGIAGFAVYKLNVKPAEVIVANVAQNTNADEVMGTGTLEARVKTTVSARIQERLAEVLVDQGDKVKAGQLLARLDDAEIKQQVAIAEATLAAARQTAERVSADLARSEAVLAQARLDHKRLMGLLASNAVSQMDTDKAVEALHVAEADLKRSNAAIAEAQGQVLVAEKTLLYRKEQMAFTQIHAPYDGLIIRRDRDPGDMLVPGGALMEIISLDEIWVSAWVDETAISKVAAGQMARIVFRSESDKNYPGMVSRIGRETDRETREFLVDVRVNELPKNWTIGQRAEVYIQTEQARP